MGDLVSDSLLPHESATSNDVLTHCTLKTVKCQEPLTQ